jgi:hypothetical protein
MLEDVHTAQSGYVLCTLAALQQDFSLNSLDITKLPSTRAMDGG